MIAPTTYSNPAHSAAKSLVAREHHGREASPAEAVTACASMANQMNYPMGLITRTSDTETGWRRRPSARMSLGGLNSAGSALAGAPNLAIMAGSGAPCPAER
jgi:hypothetical protein